MTLLVFPQHSFRLSANIYSQIHPEVKKSIDLDVGAGFWVIMGLRFRLRLSKKFLANLMFEIVPGERAVAVESLSTLLDQVH
jgi:hypothetical protein